MTLIRSAYRGCSLCKTEIETVFLCPECGPTRVAIMYKLKEIKKPDNKHKFREFYKRQLNLFE